MKYIKRYDYILLHYYDIIIFHYIIIILLAKVPSLAWDY